MMSDEAHEALPRVGSWIGRLVALCARHAWLVILLGLALLGAAGVYCARNIAIDTDTTKLISSEVPWRQREIAFDHAFPQRVDLIAIVVDGATPELAELATASLARRLGQDTVHFKSVRRPDGGAFFDRAGLLFAPVDELDVLLQRMVAAQPLLGTLAADRSLRGIADALSLMLEGARRDPAAFEQLATPLARLAEAFEAIGSGTMPAFSWRTLLTGGRADPRELRRFILVQPVLDFGVLQPGEAASAAIRNAVRELGFAGDSRIRVRLTGPVPLADEELATLADGAELDAAVMAGAIVLLLWLALRSVRLVVAVLASLVVGLAVTTAFGLFVYGRLNLISVAFAVLFVGLGVDFGIQFCVAHRATRRRVGALAQALGQAGRDIGGGLALAALSTALGFYAFVPTAYRGVSELGVIAGTGMLVAFLASVTLLPALLCVMGPGHETRPIGYRQFAPFDRFIGRHRRTILIASALVAIVSLGLAPRVRFDFNPLNLRSASVESVSTLLDLSRNPETTPNTIDVLRPSLDEAQRVAARLEALPQVDHVLTLASFVPEAQERKLALVQDAALLLDPVLHPQAKPAPSDADVVAALARAADALDATKAQAPRAIAEAMVRLATALRRLAQGPNGPRERAHEVLIPALSTMLDQLAAALSAEPVTVQSLPPELVRDWVAADGGARVEVYPKGDPNDNANLAGFVDAVRTVVPDATGAPVSIRESSTTIVRAFVEAGVYALVAITLLLAITLRHAASVVLTLAPLLLAGAVTLGICAATGFALNFANIIALPLLVGIGVAFDIYFIMGWRAGRAHLLASSLTRAVLYSALTTGSAFGSLWLSHHPGTSSMGKLLALSLALTLAAVLVFLPALLQVVPRRR